MKLLEDAVIPTRVRLTMSLALGVLSGLACWWLLRRFAAGAGDFTWAYTAASDLLAGRDPYGRPFSTDWTPYPLPAALVAVPFIFLSPEIAGGCFFGIISALMAYGLTSKSHVGLLAFLSCPFWVCLLWAQWTPLIVASAFVPVLMFIAIVKPHVAAPVVLTRLNKTGVISAVAVLIASLVIYPTWPIKWLSQIGDFQKYIPLVSVPGPLLLLALRRWRERDAQLLILASIFPQRWFYDALILWLIPKTRKEFLYTAAFSWGAYIWRLYHMPQNWIELGFVCVLFFYLPMLLVILLREPELRRGT